MHDIFLIEVTPCSIDHQPDEETTTKLIIQDSEQLTADVRESTTGTMNVEPIRKSDDKMSTGVSTLEELECSLPDTEEVHSSFDLLDWL